MDSKEFSGGMNRTYSKCKVVREVEQKSIVMFDVLRTHTFSNKD